MKKIVLFILIALTIVSCTDAGTVEHIDQANHPKYNIEEYYYKDGESIIIAERKDDPTLRTVNQTVQQGKQTVQYTYVIDDNVSKQDGTKVNQDYLFFNRKQVLLENDSIIIIRK